ncbi:formylglycine-generating enzyme family protein [Streptomyces sp. NPDC006640]|uniref:formylglycine-generating enzyme family protein n=1 Tax=Streptomyces sp. NPDC006640 TaxID=3364754 RepID=UPI00367D8754
MGVNTIYRRDRVHGIRPRQRRRARPPAAPSWSDAPLDPRIRVDDFHIDTFPTTNADYARFCAATRYPAPEHWEKGRCPRELYDHPVVHVTWCDARAYANWAGKSLPTAEQWEKAARGTSGRTFPWGDQKTAAKCNVRETGVEVTTSVSRFHSGVSPYGVYDMVGNVWEWLATPTTPGRHELRGSAFTSHLFRGVPAVANDASDSMHDDDTGFRCAVTPEQMLQRKGV